MARTLQRSLATRPTPGQRPTGIQKPNGGYSGKMPGKQRQLAIIRANGGGKPVVHPTSTSNTKSRRKPKPKQTGAHAMALAALRRIADNKDVDKNIGKGSCKICFQKAPVRRFCVRTIRAVDHNMRVGRGVHIICIDLMMGVLSAKIPASLPITDAAGRITTKTNDFITGEMVQKIGRHEKVDDLLPSYEQSRKNDEFVPYRMTYV